MKFNITVLLLCLFSSISNAGILDVFQYGVKNNPDRYVSLSILATYDHSVGFNTVPAVSANPQASEYNSRGLRGVLNIPLDANSTFLLGGSASLGDYNYTETNQLFGQNGNTKDYRVEAGFKFYIHD